MGILTIKDLSLTLNGSKILDNLNLDVWEGRVHALVGPNGAGKSTFAYTVMGLSGYRDIEGDILLEGESIKSLSVDERARKGITLAWQEPARYEGLKVRDFIGAPAEDKSEGRIREVLSRVGLAPADYINRAVDKTLSGGERKKIELASILATNPKLVFLDEPDSGIDVESLGMILDAVNILKARGSTVVLITHSLTVLGRAEHAFLLCNGRIIAKGGVEKIKEYFEGKCIPCDVKNQPDRRDR